MKKSLIVSLLMAGSITLASAQLAGCAIVAGVCMCLNTATGAMSASTAGCAAGGVVGSTYGVGSVNASPLMQLIDQAQILVAKAVPFLTGLAVVALFWYIVQYVYVGGESPEKRKLSLAGMGYSILAILVMVAIWGIIAFIASMLGIGVGGRLRETCLPGVNYPVGSECRPTF